MTDSAPPADGEAGGQREKETHVVETRSPGGARAASPLLESAGAQEIRDSRHGHSPKARQRRLNEERRPEGERSGRDAVEASSPEWQAGRARNREISEQRKFELQDQARALQGETRSTTSSTRTEHTTESTP